MWQSFWHRAKHESWDEKPDSFLPQSVADETHTQLQHTPSSLAAVIKLHSRHVQNIKLLMQVTHVPRRFHIRQMSDSLNEENTSEHRKNKEQSVCNSPS